MRCATIRVIHPFRQSRETEKLMDVNTVCQQLIDALGGRANIQSNMACMTRLRIGVRNMDLVDVDRIKSIDGVMAVVKAEVVQVVFGPGTVLSVLDAFTRITGLPKDGSPKNTQEAKPYAATSSDEVSTIAAEQKQTRENKRAGHFAPLRRLLKRVASVFVLLLPGIVAAGLINGIVNVANVATGGTLSGVWWYEAIHTLGWALFAYLPIFVGYNAAREWGGSPILGGVAGALCVANSAMPLLASYGNNQVVLPLTGSVYNPSQGGLISALLAGALVACLERWIRSWMPRIVDTFLTPLLSLVIGSLAIVCALQPIGSAATNAVYAVMNFLYTELGIVGGFLMSAGFLPLVSVGMHQALTPIHVMLNDPSGPTGGINYLLPILMMSGGGQIGAGLALYLKTKNQRLRGYIRDAIPVGVLGVGEPLMYAVTLPLGRPFVCACLGAGIGGALSTLFHIGTVSQGVSGLFGLLIVQPGQELVYVAAMLAAYVGGFAITWFFGVDEARINEVFEA